MYLPRWQNRISLLIKKYNLSPNSKENILFLCCLVFLSKNILCIMLGIKYVRKNNKYVS